MRATVLGKILRGVNVPWISSSRHQAQSSIRMNRKEVANRT